MYLICLSDLMFNSLILLLGVIFLELKEVYSLLDGFT